MPKTPDFTCTLPPRALTLLRARLGAALIPLAFVLGGVYAFWPAAAVIAAAGSAAAAVFMALRWLPAYVRGVSVTVERGMIRVQKGAWLRHSHLLPEMRMVYAEQLHTPLMSFLGLCAVRLNASRKTLTVTGLSRADADTLTALLTQAAAKEIHP